MEERKNRSVQICFAVTASLVVLAGELLGLLGAADLLPGRYFLLAALALFLAVALVAGLLLVWKHRVVQWIGLGIGVLFGAALILGDLAALRGLSTLSSVTMPETEVTHIGIFVKAEDPAESPEDVRDGPFGILGALNREAVDISLQEVGGETEPLEFETPRDLIDALRRDEVRAIVMNSAYLDLLEETDGYRDVYEELRELNNFEIVLDAVPTEPPKVVDTEQSEGPVEPFLLYISGIDSRKGLNVTSCSDSNILAAVNPKEKQLFLLSTPRDYCMPLSISNGAPDKLSHAGVHGIQCSIDTLEMFYDVDIDYYFRVHFKGFREIVDALGGLVVYSDVAFNAKEKPEYHYVEGYNMVDGDRALHFARERYAFPDGDIQRGKNQMQVIQLLLKKVLSPSILMNYTSLLEAVEGNFETSIPYDLIADLVREQLDDPGDWDVVTYTVTGTNSTAKTFTYGTAYVMIPDDAMVETAKGLLKDVLAGKRIEKPKE